MPKGDADAANVFVLCLVVTLGISIATVPILWFIGPWLMDSMGAHAVAPFVLLLPIGVLGGGALMAFTGWMVRLKSYGEIAANRLTQSGTVAVAQVGLGVAGTGAGGLLFGTVVGSLAGSSRLFRAAWRASEASFRTVTRAGVRAAAIRYRRFPIYSAPSIALNILGLELPLLWMVAVYGTDAGGQFALAQRIVALPVGVVAGAVGQVYFAEAARLVHDGTPGLRALFLKTTRSLALTAIGPFTLGALLSPFLFGIIFGQAWTEAGVYVAILAPMYFLQFVTWPTGGTLDVLERQDLHLVREIGRLLLVGGAVILATSLHLSATGGVIAMSIAGCVTNLAYGYISWRAITHHRPRPGAHPAPPAAPAG